jgi:viroplasmin and RNaseH domain-containing protein
LDKTWAECEKRVKGKSGAKYKKVFSKKEEQDLIAEWTLKSLS